MFFSVNKYTPAGIRTRVNAYSLLLLGFLFPQLALFLFAKEKGQ